MTGFPACVKINNAALKMFTYYVIERNCIFKRKELEHEPWPWTDDRILQDNKFTNIKRFQDKQCRYLIERVSQNNRLTYTDKLLSSIIFRIWSKCETFDLFVDKETGAYPVEYVRNLDYEDLNRRRDAKLIEENNSYRWYTGAFDVFVVAHCYSSPDDPKGYLAPLRLAQKILGCGVLDRIENAGTSMEVYDAVASMRMLSKFFAYQIFTDFTYIPGFPFSEDDLVICGTGSSSGVDLLFENKGGLLRENLVWLLYEHQDEVFADYDLKKEFDYPMYYRGDKVLSLHDFENSLCEFSKYYRAKLGIHRCKRKYKHPILEKQKPLF